MSDFLVTIATYPNPVEGEIACEFLCSEGFSAQIANQAMQTAILGAGNPLVRIELKVPPAEAAAALRCLQEQQAAMRPSEEVADRQAPSGPEVAPPRSDGMYRTDWNERERLVERAYRCSVLGPFVPIPFLSWYALFCTVRALGRKEPLRPSQQRRLVVATVVSSLFSLGWVVLFVVLLRPAR